MFQPIQFPNWEIEVTLKIHGKGKELCGDGLVIWYAKERLRAGHMFGSTEYFNGLAIVLDTYNNNNGQNSHRFPYISGIINNGR